MVEGVVFNVDQQIINQRRKQFHVISGYKNSDGSFKKVSIYINSVVAGTVLVPVPVNLPATAPLLTIKRTTIVPAKLSTSVPTNHSTHVDPAPVPTTITNTASPALLPTTTTVRANHPTIVSPAPYPTITTDVPSIPPNPVVPEPDTTTTTCVHANSHTQNAPVPDPDLPPQNSSVSDLNPPLTNVAPVPDTPSPTISTPTVVVDCHGVKWYNYEDVIYLYELPSLRWKFTNQFGDLVYPNSGVWMSRIDA